MGTPVILVFSEYQVDVLNTWNDVVYCIVRTRLTTLRILLERQRQTQLFKADLY